MWLKLSLTRDAAEPSAAAAAAAAGGVPPSPQQASAMMTPTAGLTAEELLSRGSAHSLERLQSLLYHTYGAAHFNKKVYLHVAFIFVKTATFPYAPSPRIIQSIIHPAAIFLNYYPFLLLIIISHFSFLIS